MSNYAIFRNNPKAIVIEVTDTETKDHADNKIYPSCFKVVSCGVEDEEEGLL